MPINFIDGENPKVWTHIFEKNDNSEKKLKKNKSSNSFLSKLNTFKFLWLNQKKYKNPKI